MHEKEIKVLASWDFNIVSSVGFIVHAIRHPNSELLQRRAEDVFSTWDIISCSLVPAIGGASINAIGNAALVLKVPPQNILGTHEQDVWFPNHRGTPGDQGKFVIPSSASATVKNGGLVKALHSGKDLRGRDRGNFRKLVAPQTLLLEHYDIRSAYTEILVVGRPDVNVYFGLPTTKKIEVIGLVNLSRSAGNNATFERLRNVNPGVRAMESPNELRNFKHEMVLGPGGF